MLWRAADWLWLLLLAPVFAGFLWWALRRRRLALQRFAEARLLPALVPELDLRRYRWRAALGVLAVALIALALAGPQWGFHWQEVRREGVDVIVALDTSRSMQATDVKPNRLARAKLAITDLVRELQGDRIGLVAFAGTAFVQCPLTVDYGAFDASLRAVHTGIIPRGGTALAAAIDTALEAFEARQSKHEALVLITDGEDHEGDVAAAAKRAAERGVKIYTVGIGTTAGELIPGGTGEGDGFLKDRQGNVVKSRLDENTLQQIATDTGGAYVHGEGPDLGLAILYRDYIARMDKRELHTAMQRRYEERFQWPLLLAVLLLLVEPLIGDRRRRKTHSAARVRRWRGRRREAR
ncbi:VWA domain-containing protein [Candidatus Binatia bacterium]|nr:VWA domain-containing protein [Candidatus Binatia bacterium]